MTAIEKHAYKTVRTWLLGLARDPYDKKRAQRAMVRLRNKYR